MLRRFSLLLLFSVFCVAGANAAALFYDSFDSGASALWGNQSGNWVTNQGAYYASSPNRAPNGASLLPFDISDFIVDVDVKGASDGGVWLRSNTNRTAGVLLVVGGRGHSGTGLYWHVGPDYSTIVNESPGLFNQGDDIHVQVKVSGDTYSAYLNGSSTPATTLVTNTAGSGAVGLYDFTGQTHGNQAFDNFEVSTVTAVPEPSSALLAGTVLAVALAGMLARRRKDNLI